MLFNSPEFIFLFLPVTLLIFIYISYSSSYKIGIGWLVVASLFFYSWWNPPYLLLLVFSIVFNYFVGSILSRNQQRTNHKKLLLALGISINLALIGYFKYTNFLVDTLNAISGSNLSVHEIILPLAISFFTFQQIAYLVDSYRGETENYGFLEYCLFVTFFPQLIAGPIVHHKEVLPQFSEQKTHHFSSEDLAVGITIFTMGLFKKVIFADNIALYASPVFSAASDGTPIMFIDGWVGALAYTLQLYFDFSGYSDMAIGAARMFGIKLPLNFNSPYKAVSISDFWRRWHITLSNFLRDYLYIPMGGSRKGEFRRNQNLMMTMLLGGLWHGAGWTFVFWGGLHGFYLIVNHKWRTWRKSLGQDPKKDSWLQQRLGWMLTFLAVVIGWVFFRADSMETAFSILKGMIGLNGISSPDAVISYTFSSRLVLGLSILLIIAWFAPNTQQWLAQYNPALDMPKNRHPSRFMERVCKRFSWQPNQLSAIALACAVFIILKHFLTAPSSEFLYFQF
ncbi:MAG: MBOAT family protein [Cyanobacteriota bacterium]|nr:MBOAT family protein [Cyanobacteriota bacterium]